jgi:hypothetical protein
VETDLGYETPCYLWTTTDKHTGYGQVTIAGVHSQVHRLAYRFFKGRIPAGYEIDHLCHNACDDCPGGKVCIHRRCLNPAHLEAVPRQTNARRSRHVTKLTADDVRAIRASTDTQVSIGKAYGLGQAQISRIKNFKRWRDIP